MYKSILPILGICLISIACKNGDNKAQGGLSILGQQEAYVAPLGNEDKPASSPIEQVNLDKDACYQKILSLDLQISSEADAPSTGQSTQLEARARLLSAALGEPIWFTEEPPDVTPEAQLSRTLKEQLSSTKFPYDVIKRIVATFGYSKSTLRDIFLRDGYLWTESPEQAFAMIDLLSIDSLFGHNTLWLQRGAEEYELKRIKSSYVYVAGDKAGEKANLMLFDRLSITPNLTPLHIDLRVLRHELSATRFQIIDSKPSHIALRVYIDSQSRTMLARRSGSKLTSDCIVNDDLAFRQAQASSQARAQQLSPLYHATNQQIEEALPFDEPRREFGLQLDGRLRGNWRWAYYNKRLHYNFNGDKYSVFGRFGQPLVPQVCVDFLFDTLERASGGWYAARGEKPELRRGLIDLDREKRAEFRRVPEFIQYVNEHPQFFDSKQFDQKTTPELGDSEEFNRYLLAHPDFLQPGDLVVIGGEVPWDKKHEHYHSFIIYDSDPISGFPQVIAGNASYPQLRAWETEAHRTPHRKLLFRARLKSELLEALNHEQYDPRSEIRDLAISSRRNR